jgi:hypothetical protein
MSSVGIQPRGAETPRGLQYVKVSRPGKIVSRYCNPGDVVMVEPAGRTIMPNNDGLTEDYAEKLINLGIVRRHQLQPGDKPISVRPIPPRQYAPDAEEKVETGMLPGPKGAERAVAKPQRGAV